MVTIRWASGYGRLSKRIGLAALNTAVLAPIPSASVRMTTSGETGVASQPARAVPHIGDEGLDDVLPPTGADLFPQDRRIADLRRAARRACSSV